MLFKFLLALWLLAIPAKPELIELKKDNFVSLRETINQDSSSRLLSKLNSIETKHNVVLHIMRFLWPLSSFNIVQRDLSYILLL